MLRPKNLKFDKFQKRVLKTTRKRGNLLQWRSNSLKFGDYGLRAIDGGLVKAAQIEACKQVIKRKLKRQGQLWVRIFPSISLTSKPIEVRMGKGKGNVDSWGIPVKPGQIIFEITGVAKSVAEIALQHGGNKLPMKTQIIENIF